MRGGWGVGVSGAPASPSFLRAGVVVVICTNLVCANVSDVWFHFTDGACCLLWVRRRNHRAVGTARCVSGVMVLGCVCSHSSQSTTGHF